MTGELSLFSIGNGLLAPTECAEALLSLNKLTQSRGLVLSPEQALALEQCRAAALEETGRLEMGQGILPELIYAFYDSPCLSPETYPETLNALTALFYRGKTAAQEAVSDGSAAEIPSPGIRRCLSGQPGIIGGRAGGMDGETTRANRAPFGRGGPHR